MKKIILSIIFAFTAMSGFSADVLTLEQCRNLAEQNNIGIRQADNSIAGAEEDVKNAGAAFYPKVEGSGILYHSTDDIVNTEFMGQSFNSGKNLYSVGVNASVPLYTGGQLTNTYRLSEVGAETSRLQKQKSIRDVDIQTTKYYWRIVMLQAKIRTLDTADSLLADVHRTVGNAVKNGLKNRNDLLKVELRQSENESSRLELDNAIKVAKKLLAQYIGRYDTDFDVVDGIDLSSLPEQPLANKKDHRQVVGGMLENQLLGKQVEADKLEVDLEHGKQLPTVAVSVGYDYTRFWGESSSGAAVYATLQVPISDWLWGGTTHAIKSKQKKLDNARLEQLNSEQLLRINLDNLWYNVEVAYKNLGIARKSIEQSEENLRLNRNSYYNGLSTMTELLDAEFLLQQSRDKYVSSYSDYQSKLFEYQAMTGGSY